MFKIVIQFHNLNFKSVGHVQVNEQLTSSCQEAKHKKGCLHGTDGITRGENSCDGNVYAREEVNFNVYMLRLMCKSQRWQQLHQNRQQLLPYTKDLARASTTWSYLLSHDMMTGIRVHLPENIKFQSNQGDDSIFPPTTSSSPSSIVGQGGGTIECNIGGCMRIRPDVTYYTIANCNAFNEQRFFCGFWQACCGSWVMLSLGQ